MVPATPAPWTARPATSTADAGAAAHTAEPAPKRPTAAQKTTLSGNAAYSRPNVGCSAMLASAYAAPYHAMSLSVPKSDVILGIAVAVLALPRQCPCRSRPGQGGGVEGGLEKGQRGREHRPRMLTSRATRKIADIRAIDIIKME